jgi:hypothetical protein
MWPLQYEHSDIAINRASNMAGNVPIAMEFRFSILQTTWLAPIYGWRDSISIHLVPSWTCPPACSLLVPSAAAICGRYLPRPSSATTSRNGGPTRDRWRVLSARSQKWILAADGRQPPLRLRELWPCLRSLKGAKFI